MTLVDEAKVHLEALGTANRAFMARYPGERSARQPVHTVYGGAHLYKAETTRRLGELALESLNVYGRDALEFADGVGFVSREMIVRAEVSWLSAAYARDPGVFAKEHPHLWLAFAVYERVREKLAREAVEDFRI